MIVGLDISLNGFGLAVYDNGIIIYRHTITHPKGLDEQTKLHIIQQYLLTTLSQYKITLAVLEDTFFSNNVKTLKQLMRVHGIAIAVLNMYCIKYMYKTPMTVKKSLLGKVPKGSNTKTLVQNEIYKMFPYLTNLTYDESDAIALIVCYLNGD